MADINLTVQDVLLLRDGAVLTRRVINLSDSLSLWDAGTTTAVRYTASYDEIIPVVSVRPVLGVRMTVVGNRAGLP